MPTDPRTRDELIEALPERGCPICALVERAERKAIDHFLYDQVNDIRLRDQLRASRGYCLHHTAMLSQGRSALGIAIVSRDILRAMTAELEAGAAGGWPWQRGGAALAGRVGPHADCPMCTLRPQIEEPLLLGLLQNLDDPSFHQAFAQGDGMCRSHLAQALRMASPAQASALAQVAAQQWRRAEAALDEFIRKHDYRFNDESMDEERDIWLRALQLSSGWRA
ncbi:hypothetical protein F8S13_05695 [Chloroflexia bacterium SDU3-3]|nr:hypothetical protein F8S13_05695 [Chloroflexia bacterium SDU3-3]